LTIYGAGFETLDDGQAMLSVVRVGVGDVVGPEKVLVNRKGSTTRMQMVLGSQWQPGLELTMDGGQVVFLKHNQELPAVAAAQVERGATGKQTIQEQAERQVGETLLQAVRQTVKGLEFTILLGRMFTGIFDELGH
jgi:hypothetical protein